MLHIILIGGRKQSEGSSNGMMECEEVLLESLDKAGYTSSQVRTRFLPWYADWSDVARRMHLTRLRYRLSHPQFGIVVGCFSRGVGYGLVELGKQVPRFGLTIDSAVVCDGIYHRWWALWRSLYFGYRIEIPQCVQKVYSFYQDQSTPKGLKPYVIPPTQVLGVEKLNYDHVEMDDSAEFHAKMIEVVLDAARRYVPQKKATTVATEQVASPLEKLECKLETATAITESGGT